MGWFSKPSPLLDVEKGDNGSTVSVYQDGRRLMDVAMIMYLLPELREAASQGKLDQSEAVQRITTLPCTPFDINRVFTQQAEKLKDVLGDDAYLVYQKALSASAYTNDKDQQEKLLKSTEIVILDDTKADSTLVYSMAVSHLTRRIYVVFRGSVTMRDFVQDAKMHLSSIPNPALGVGKNLPNRVGVHSGFREYLYDPSHRDGSSKFHIILQQLKNLVQQYPNYRIYIGGHSLGGALATLLAFEAASLEEIPKPVTAIPTAAPKVGNKAFLVSFEALEELGYLRCLHIANDRDVVTLSPSASAFNSTFALFCQHRLYRHVGIHLTLSPASYAWTYPPKLRSFLLIALVDTLNVMRNWFDLVFVYPTLVVFHVLCCCFMRRTSYADEHSCVTYFERFDKFKEDLEALTVESVYQARKNRAWWRTSSLPRKLNQ